MPLRISGLNGLTSVKPLEKTAVVLYAVSKFGEIPGKKALQKIMYFVNIRTPLFSFRWHTFGPYSEELKYELDTAIMEGMVIVTPTVIRNNEGTQFNIKLSKNGRRNLRGVLISEDVISAVESAFKLLNHKNGREMELLASTHYIISQNEGQTNDEFVWSLLNELKPEARFTLQDVKRALIQLRNRKLVP